MRVESLAIALRARQGWEAIDLGFRMAMHWARPLWTVWLAVYLPTAVAVLTALWQEPLAAAIVLWWLKPVLDRFALFVLSRRVFGEAARLADALGAWRSVLSPGLWRALVLRPFGWDRSFLQPIPLLERSAGRAARQRASLLGRRLGGHAMALALVCMCFEGVVVITVATLDQLLTPAAEIGGTRSSGLAETLGVEWWGIGVTLAYAMAIALIEPFYVAAGFSMYLVRRTQLEGWDLELALRRVGAARESQGRAGVTLVGALLIGLLCGVPADTARAESSAAPVDAPNPASKRVLRYAQEQAADSAALAPLDTPARRAVVEVLKHKDFGYSVERLRWNLAIEKKKDSNNEMPEFEWLERLGEWVAVGLRLLGWLVIAALALSVIWLLARHYGGRPRPIEFDRPPSELFGLEIDPDSLPDDVVRAALQLLDEGRGREAVSLLYRGALSYLVHEQAMRIGSGAVEGEVLGIARPLLSADAGAHFARLVQAWVDIAYGHRRPEIDQLRALAQAQRGYFVAAPTAPLSGA